MLSYGQKRPQRPPSEDIQYQTPGMIYGYLRSIVSVFYRAFKNYRLCENEGQGQEGGGRWFHFCYGVAYKVHGAKWIMCIIPSPNKTPP